MTGSPDPGGDPAWIASRGRSTVVLFAATTLLGAFLLFWIQPLFTRSALPLLGGTPGVWNTALVFFQATLLAGYAYAHATTRWLSPRRQFLVHLGVLGAASLALPIGPVPGWSPPTGGTPSLWLLGFLAVSIGLPFFAISATAPLVQRWLARTDHPDAGDPYFLYAASNLGSLAALLAFPLLLEPRLGIERQERLWSWGFVALALLLAGCAVVALRRRVGRPEALPTSAPSAAPSAAPTIVAGGSPGASAARENGWRRRLRWVLLAAVPSSLLLGVTGHISTDLASFPLLWVVPLGLYLLTYTLAFARRPPLPHRWMLRAQPYLLILLALSLSWGAARRVLVFDLTLHLVAFTVLALVCHRELAELRPPAERLTEFYLWLSAGGVLGGAFTALAAPVLFDAVLEYPLTLVAAAMLRPALRDPGTTLRPADLLAPAALAAVALGGIGLVGADRIWDGLGSLGALALFGTTALVTFTFLARPVRFGLGLGALLLVGSWSFEPTRLLARERSFFGVHRVVLREPGPVHQLLHGTTVHGAQHMAPDRRREPLTYYAREGPLGDVFRSLEAAGRPRVVGAVGLGTGTVACYRKPGQSWTFYEIDPVVIGIARDTTLFRYLEECGEGVRIELGDGRTRLRHVPDGRFDLLILDAFSSDAIPIHLLTREAVELYASKLAPGGWVALHISNRYLELRPVAANVIRAAGLAGRVRAFSPGSAKDDRPDTGDGGAEEARDKPGRDAESTEVERHITASTWVVATRRDADLAPLDRLDGWAPLEPDPSLATWTDDFSHVLEALEAWPW